jgi:uncharacterized protein
MVRRWRWRRVAGGLAAALTLLVVAALGGIAWYFSTLAVGVDHSTSRPAIAWPGPDGTVTITRHHEASLPGRYGLDWDGGYGTVGAVTATATTTGSATVSGEASSLDGSAADGTVTRRFTQGSGTLTPGTRVLLDSFAYRGDPRTALGLNFQQVAVPTELGAMPAWYVPATDDATADRGRTWVVFVHGHDSNRQESLRYLTALHRLRLPVLVVTYRNDVGAPASPDGIDHLGETEWRDVAAALTWVQHTGGRDVVLAGWSMGGAVSLQAWDRGGLRGFVRGMVLDSPVVSWRDVLMFQGGERGLPSPVTDLALRVMQLRSGIDLDRLDWVARERELTVPMLVFASDDDTYVPDGPAKHLAADRPDLVTFVNVPGADHTRSWNVDPTAYEARLTQWLNAVGATSS